MPTCDTCGRETSEHERDIRFRLPASVLATEEQDEAPGVWQTDDDAITSVMMYVPDVGAFVRALLPVRLTDGYSVTYGVWVAISEDDLQHASKVWWAPEYEDLRIRGHLANVVEPWGLLDASVDLAVLDSDATPYCVASDDPELNRVLSTDWPHELVLSTLPV